MPSQGSQQPHPATPHPGAWTQENGHWKWNPTGLPDSTLAGQYGTEALTNVERDPGGTLNHGAWTPVHGGGWSWTWGANPNPSLVNTWGEGALTNPTQTPQGAGGVGTPPPTDVVPPTVADTWNGVAPSVTGELPPTEGDPTTVNEPPSHPPYAVSPGGIRNAEQTLLTQIDAGISQYNDLKAAVEASPGSNVYPDGPTRDTMMNTQHQALMQIGDTLQLAGMFVNALNTAAQNYAHADLGSFLPQS